MRAEFYRPGRPEEVVAVARWYGRSAHLQLNDESVSEALGRLFRPTPVVVDDGANRRLGTRGEVALQPGTLEWFRAAALTRAAEAGMAARIVPGVEEGGWDPAAAYRSFEEAIERLGPAEG